ncbi:MAG: PAS domain-containing protein [Candidatus Methanoperedens sp.]|nr:chemotaxis protein CheB [Candidatus Methanoperedens sp. BLZ2]KAB2941501.1 MAG: PAS domain-containing protein [Candidatus Methanoperedens sp.]MBZ0173723.1 PAS domain-containing protein [Candidatus Methanoperedens nitroreducens]MCX9079039.1 PAS domain-containing protein [Candidatus Methanoperedens sp.]
MPEKKSKARKNKVPIKPDEESTFSIVGIGASAGGLEALEKIFINMPHDSGMAFVIVMHFDPTAKSVMADILMRYTKMEVFQVEDGMKVEPNHVYIIPPNKDMAILHGTLHLYEPVVSKGIRHPIDFFFRSLADDRKENAICIILSGTGTEGTLGLKAIKGEDGMVMVQSMESAAYDGMPGSAIATGLVDYILPPEKMPEQLVSYVKQFYTKKITKPERIVTEQIANSLQKIIILIRTQTGIDFSSYKQSTLIRRIERRMSLHQIENISDYVHYLQENQPEIRILHKEFLIGVTSFFRDPAAFEVLKEKIIPEILKDKGQNQPVRVWVPACSTGEEAYSVAMVFKEYMDEIKSDFHVQIFATDVDREAVEEGRSGVYPDNITVDVSPERLNRFCIKNSDDTYSIKKEIREMVVFAPQNAISDPPFLRLDLICCRNLLIYLVPESQRKLLLIFHYSLNPGGYLFLGSSETIGEFTELYSSVDKKWRFYKRIGERAHLPLISHGTGTLAPMAPWEGAKAGETKARAINIGIKIEKMLLDTYTPPCAIINEKGDILYIHGRTGKYLEPAPGNVRFNVVDMAREGLRTELNIAIHRAVAQKKDVIFQNLNVKTNGDFQTIDLKVKPVKESTMQGLIMVTFEDVPSARSPRPARSTYRSKQAKEHIADLENELKSTKENLQATIEELQASNEELKSANEELMSANEELQSTNEELNASKEELQSLNEELITLNAEHQAKLEEQSKTVSDLNNVLASTEIATLFLDNDLRIKGFTPSVTKVINLIKTDIGRPVSDIVSNLEYKDLLSDIKGVLDTLVLKEKELQDKKGFWYLTRILPYRTVDNIIDGVVITFIDITERKELQQMEKDARIYAQSIVNTVQESILVLDKDLRVISANPSFYDTFQVSPEETENKFIYDIGNGRWDIPRLKELLEEILPGNSHFKNFKVDSVFPGGRKVMLLNARRIYQEGAGTERILLAIEDITERKMIAD